MNIKSNSHIFHELVRWCELYARGKWKLTVGYVSGSFEFEDESDRMLFELIRPLVEKGLIDV